MTLITYVPSYHGTKLERKNHFRRIVSIEKKAFWLPSEKDLDKNGTERRSYCMEYCMEDTRLKWQP